MADTKAKKQAIVHAAVKAAKDAVLAIYKEGRRKSMIA